MGRFAQAVAAEATSKRGPTCGVKLLLDSLPKGERAEVVELFKSTAGHAQLARAFGRLGFTLKAGTIAKHRHGECACDAR